VAAGIADHPAVGVQIGTVGGEQEAGQLGAGASWPLFRLPPSAFRLTWGPRWGARPRRRPVAGAGPPPRRGRRRYRARRVASRNMDLHAAIVLGDSLRRRTTSQCGDPPGGTAGVAALRRGAAHRQCRAWPRGIRSRCNPQAGQSGERNPGRDRCCSSGSSRTGGSSSCPLAWFRRTPFCGGPCAPFGRCATAAARLE
jgi:hypothetical protein